MKQHSDSFFRPWLFRKNLSIFLQNIFSKISKLKFKNLKINLEKMTRFSARRRSGKMPIFPQNDSFFRVRLF
jgi:hypothetical protein